MLVCYCVSVFLLFLFVVSIFFFFFFSSRRRHTRSDRDWSSDVCSSDLLSTVRRADTIVVIERGRIIETGKHAELLALGGAYRRLYELQFADEEEIGRASCRERV